VIHFSSCRGINGYSLQIGFASRLRFSLQIRIAPLLSGFSEDVDLNASLESVAHIDVAITIFAGENYRFQDALGLRRA